jgi:hypothetical protein
MPGKQLETPEDISLEKQLEKENDNNSASREVFVLTHHGSRSKRRGGNFGGLA